MVIKSLDPAPVLTIGDSEKGTASRVDGHFELQIMNPLNTKLKAATLECYYEYQIDLTIGSEFTLTSQITNLKIEVTKYKPLFKTTQQVSEVNILIQMFVPMAETFLNEIFPHGVRLPLSLPLPIAIDVSRSNLLVHDNYLYSDTDPELNYKVESSQGGDTNNKFVF